MAVRAVVKGEAPSPLPPSLTPLARWNTWNGILSVWSNDQSTAPVVLSSPGWPKHPVMLAPRCGFTLSLARDYLFESFIEEIPDSSGLTELMNEWRSLKTANV